jgi:carboxypeptidase PM20D1
MTVLWIILALLGLFLLVTVIRAAFFKPKPVQSEPLPPEAIDAARAAAHLSMAIQIPTISHPDAAQVDWEQFRRLHRFLEDSYPLIHKTLTREIIGEANLLYRWKGANPELHPIALLSHQDVVPISAGTEGDWTHPPFSGYNDGEFIWGRGAMDMKNHLICTMEAVEALLAEGFAPERDVYLLFGQDEEVVGGANAGAKQIRETLKARGVHLESTLDEGGAMLPVHVKNILNATLAGIGISEKGYADFEISVQRKGGHSSQPPKHTGLGELAQVIQDLERHQFKAKMLPFLSDIIDAAGRRLPYYLRLVAVNHKLLRPLLLALMKKIPPAASMIHSCTAVTQAQGSPAANVLPQKASIVVNFRLMPGTSIADVERHIKKVSSIKDIQVKFLKGNEPSPFSSTDSRAYRCIQRQVESGHSDAIVAPFLVMGGTDSQFYTPICDNCYRFSPFLAEVSLLLCCHATNERVPLQALNEAVAFFKRYVREQAGA